MGLRKIHGLQGPIDDAFADSFIAVRPNPLNPQRYVVINSGHTFNDDRKLAGSESMFFPRAGDYAVVHVNPTATAGLTPVGEIRLSGFFDESWKLK